MVIDIKKIIAGAVSGFAAAFVVDVMAWSKAPKGEVFDFGIAVKRWIAGAMSGIAGAMGIAGAETL